MTADEKKNVNSHKKTSTKDENSLNDDKKTEKKVDDIEREKKRAHKNKVLSRALNSSKKQRNMEEPKKEELKKEEPRKEELKKEEPRKEELKKEEPKKEEPKTEELKKEEPKTEELKKEEPKKEDFKKSDDDIKKTREMWQRISEHSKAKEKSETYEKKYEKPVMPEIPKQNFEAKKVDLPPTVGERIAMRHKSEAAKSNSEFNNQVSAPKVQKIEETVVLTPDKIKNIEKVEKVEVVTRTHPVVKAVESEVVTEKSVDGQVSNMEQEIDEFKEDFWDILEQAGITKRTFFWVIGVFISIICLFVFLVFGGGSIFSGSGDVVLDVPDVVDDVEITELSDSSAGDLVDSSFVFGNEVSGTEDNPLDVVYFIGDDLNVHREHIIYYVDLLRRMQSMYENDIYAVLDNSIDRRKKIDDFLTEMAGLIDESELAIERINLQMDNFSDLYSSVSDQRDIYEENFFNYMDSLSGSEANESLRLFVGFGQDSLELKAFFNAYSTVLDMTKNSLKVLNPRYNDILVNKEAIIKGVRVFDVLDSDIDAIIPLDEVVK